MTKKVKTIETYTKTRRVVFIYSWIIRLISLINRKKEKVKIVKTNKIPKPPFLLLSSHASFMDFYVSIKANSPHRPYWVSTIEEYIDKDYIFRALGIIPKRKFTNDPKSAMLMMDVLKRRKKILIIYPEARYSFVGQPERIDKGLGSLAKMCDVPVVFMNCHGHYLRDPQWGDHKIRKIDGLVSEMKTIVTKSQVRANSAEDIQRQIENCFRFDDEQWQLDNNIQNTYKNRAGGLHQILYHCPHCGTEFEMSSSGTQIKCNHCGATYEYQENGLLKCLTGEGKFERVSEWYKWEKENVRQEVINGTYKFEDDVRVEHLDGVGVGFVPQKGNYHMVQDVENGILVTGDNGFKYERSSLQSYAIHIEYDYKGRGGCIDLATKKDTWFVYPLNKPEWLTKIHFATECIYDCLKDKLKDNK